MTGSRSGRPARVLVGCDVQPVTEVADAVAGFGARYLDRIYTRDEQRVLHDRGVESLAGRFAGKEAVVKLLELTGPLDHRDIEILAGGSERPRVRLTGAARSVADERGITDIDLSLSHGGGVAFAVAVALSCDSLDPRTPITDTWGDRR